MLHFFETKNIRHKPARTQLFHAYGDAVSEHDMDFDWAHETMYAQATASIGSKNCWAFAARTPAAYDQVREHCEKLVRDYVATATPHEVAQLKEAASALIAKAHAM